MSTYGMLFFSLGSQRPPGSLDPTLGVWSLHGHNWGPAWCPHWIQCLFAECSWSYDKLSDGGRTIGCGALPAAHTTDHRYVEHCYRIHDIACSLHAVGNAMRAAPSCKAKVLWIFSKFVLSKYFQILSKHFPTICKRSSNCFWIFCAFLCCIIFVSFLLLFHAVPCPLECPVAAHVQTSHCHNIFQPSAVMVWCCEHRVSNCREDYAGTSGTYLSCVGLEQRIS